MLRAIKYDANHLLKFVRDTQNDLEFNNCNNLVGYLKSPSMKKVFLDTYDLSEARFLGFDEAGFYQYLTEFEDKIACQSNDLQKKGIVYVQFKKSLASRHEQTLQSVEEPAVSSRLKMLDYAKSLLMNGIFRALYQKTLTNTLLVLTQQGYSTVINMIEALLDLGFNPQHLIVFTKPSTTADENFNAMIALAAQYHFIYVTPNRHAHQNKTEAELKQLSINEIIVAVNQKLSSCSNIKNVIYYDEGGVLVNDESFRQTCVHAWKANKKISMSEHTTSGVNRYKNNLPDMKCFMFARSWIKLKCEPFFIAQSSFLQVQEILHELYINRHTLVIGLIGCGNVGSEFARCLIEFAINKQVRILIHDIKFQTSADYPTDLIELAHLHGVNLQFASAEYNTQLVNQSDIIFGSTGQDMSRYLFEVRPQVDPKYLASISSGKREFESIVNEQAEEHSHTRHRFNQQEYILLNRGYPLNFKRSLDSVDPSQIQLIRASTLLLIFQELMYLQKLEILDNISQEKSQHSRFLRFNAFFQYLLFNRFKALQNEMPEHLRLPDRILNQSTNLQDMIDFSLGYDSENPDQAIFEIDNSSFHSENFLSTYDQNHDLHFKEEKDRIVFYFQKHGTVVEDLSMLEKICERNHLDRHMFSLENRLNQIGSMIQRFSRFNPSAVNISEKQFSQSYHH
jgi:hypothetical protein